MAELYCNNLNKSSFIYRDLAHEMGHPWAEYWDFLDSFVDLSSTDGLRKLEEYLSKRDFSPRAHEEAGENETSNRFKTPSPGTFICSVSGTIAEIRNGPCTFQIILPDGIC